MNWADVLKNPKGQAFKKTIFEFLKERYSKNEDIIERLSYQLVTEKDMQNFIKMLFDVYEIAYLKAVEDHREQLTKLGLAVKVVSPDQKDG